MSTHHAQYVLLFLVLAVILPGFNFTELHALTQAAHSYVLLVPYCK